jgi:hypothetical protein
VRICKKTFYLQFCMRTPEGHQKSIFNASKVKKTKIHMGSIRQSLQAQPKNIKKLLEHQIYQSKRKFFEKSMFSSLKVKTSQKVVWELPTEFASSTQNVEKNCRNIKSTNQNKKIPNKSMFI